MKRKNAKLQSWKHPCMLPKRLWCCMARRAFHQNPQSEQHHTDPKTCVYVHSGGSACVSLALPGNLCALCALHGASSTTGGLTMMIAKTNENTKVPMTHQKWWLLKKTKQKTKAPGGGYVVGPHRWCFHRWPQEFGLNIDKVDAGQNLFAKCIQKTQSPASISFASNSFLFPFNFLFSTTFFFPSCRPHYQKRNHQSVVSCLCFLVDNCSQGTQLVMPQPHSLQPHGILFGGAFKGSKKCQQQWP